MHIKTKKITLTAMFAAMATLLMYLEIPLPFMPPFLKLDPSLLPILIGSFSLGPVSAVCMSFVKASIHLLSTQTGGVGELADFLMTSAFALTAAFVYKKNHTKDGAKIACILGTVALTIMGIITNTYLLIPFYSRIMPLDAIFEACSSKNSLITGMSGYILFGVIPFNLIKGIIISLITFAVYKRISKHIHHFMEGMKKMAYMVSKDSIVGEILDYDPTTAPYFNDIGMFCLGCPHSRMETIEQACAAHGVNYMELLRKLNEHFANK